MNFEYYWERVIGYMESANMLVHDTSTDAGSRKWDVKRMGVRRTGCGKRCDAGVPVGIPDHGSR